MRNKTVNDRSSYLTSLFVLGFNLLLGVLSAVRGWKLLSASALLLFALGALARLWAHGAVKRLHATLRGLPTGLFPGDTLTAEIIVKNDKLLPIARTELHMPLPTGLSLLPESVREPTTREGAVLRAAGASDKKLGEYFIGHCGGYETRRETLRLTAQRRGICQTGSWKLRTGDGFGLMQTELPLGGARPIAVYPRLTEIETDIFLRRLWNADTGPRGITADPTVIRSTRDYTAADSARHINWRLLARGLPLTVNTYEDILPQSIHFLFDGESFSGSTPHPEEMEETLSLLASAVVQLTERGVPCGVSLCAGKGAPPVDLFAPGDTEAILYALAAYEPTEALTDEKTGERVQQTARFDTEAILAAAQHIGRFYAVTRESAAWARQKRLSLLGADTLSLLTWDDGAPFGEYEVLRFPMLRKEAGHER